MTRVSVLQSNYIPWKGYFDIIHDVDTFIFYDDVQYTKNDWRNRNIIIGPGGAFWLTIPIPKSSVNFKINQSTMIDPGWQKKHLGAFNACYSRSKYFDEQEGLIDGIYSKTTWSNLSSLNEYCITRISKKLGIHVEFLQSSAFTLTGTKLDRLMDLLQQVGADEYVSGPAGRGYIDESRFESAGIKLIYKEYAYPEYHQLWNGAFNHKVSILDLLFNEGKNSPYYIWGWRDDC